MTTCRDIIIAAQQEINALDGPSPTSADATLALRRLNALLATLHTSGIGEPLTDATSQGAATAWGNMLRPNYRILVSGLSSALTLTMPGDLVGVWNYPPADGAKLQLVDVDGRFATYPVTLARNGRKINGVAADYVANTNGFNTTFFYRADLGDWVPLTNLALNDTFPLPDDCEDPITLLLAFRLSPRFGPQLPPESKAALQAAEVFLSAKYHQPQFIPADLAVIYGSVQATPPFYVPPTDSNGAPFDPFL